MDSRVPPILKVPLELRYKIYHELCAPWKVFDENTKSYDMQTSILRVNKQLHKEGIEVLYNQIPWILVSANWAGLAQPLKNQGCPIVSTRGPLFLSPCSFHWDPTSHYPRSSNRYRFSKRMVTGVNLRDLDCSSTIKGTFLVMPDKWHQVCTAMAFLVLGRREITMDFPQWTQGFNRQGEMLDALQSLYGFEKSTVLGDIAESRGQELERLLTQPFQTMDEITCRASAYKSRGDKLYVAAEFCNARAAYADAIKWIKHQTINSKPPWLLTACDLQWHGLLNIVPSCSFGVAMCYIRQGEIQRAASLLTKMMFTPTKFSQMMSATDKADILLCLGFLHGVQLNHHGVITCLEDAIKLRPCWKEASDALKALKSFAASERAEKLKDRSLSELRTFSESYRRQFLSESQEMVVIMDASRQAHEDR